MHYSVTVFLDICFTMHEIIAVEIIGMKFVFEYLTHIFFSDTGRNIYDFSSIVTAAIEYKNGMTENGGSNAYRVKIFYYFIFWKVLPDVGLIKTDRHLKF